jgi:tetratricopeptide (TPR) repeat protein
LADELPGEQKGVRSRVLLYTVLSVVVIGIFGVGIYLATRPKQTNDMSTVLRWTLTSSPTSTETLTPQPTSTGYAAVVVPQDITLTPTLLYVATPHNRMEAYNAAMRAYEKGNWPSAIDFFKQVLESEPNSPDIYYHIGDCYRFLGQYAEADSAYQSALSIDANFAPAYLGKGRVILAKNSSKLNEAIELFKKAVAKDPQIYEAYLELAKADLALGNTNATLGWLEKYTQYANENSFSAMYRSQAYLELGDTEQALTLIEDSIRLDPTNLAAYQIWGQTLQANGQFVNSIPPLLAVIDQNPLDLKSQTLLARAYYEAGNMDEAMALINTLLEQDEENIEAYLLRGDIYLEQGEIDKANSDFNAVLRIDYNSFDANVGLGRVLLAKTLAGAAFNKFDYTEKLVKTDAQKAILIYWKAQCLLGLGEESSAIKKFNEALEYGGGVLPRDLQEDALDELSALYTPTPTLKATLTPSGTSATAATTVTPNP